MSVIEDAVRAREGDAGGVRTDRRAWRRFFASTSARFGGGTLVLLFAVCWIVPWFRPSPTKIDLDSALESPSWAHWFGTDELGRDLLARVLVAGRSSLGIAITVALAASLLGAFIGVLAGYRGGIVDGALMSVTDLWLVLPAIPVLAVAATIGDVDLPGPLPVVDLSSSVGIAFVLSLILWGSTARVVRATARAVRERPFVLAARAAGARPRSVMVRHVMPHCLGPILVEAALLAAGGILFESTLSFLGFGVQPPTPTWGNLLTGALSDLRHAWWLAVFPGLALLLSVLAINALGDGLRDAFDPRRAPLERPGSEAAKSGER